MFAQGSQAGKIVGILDSANLPSWCLSGYLLNKYYPVPFTAQTKYQALYKISLGLSNLQQAYSVEVYHSSFIAKLSLEFCCIYYLYITKKYEKRGKL